MKALALVSFLSTVLCMYNVDCPSGTQCASDENGRGTCVVSEATATSGKIGDGCVSVYDCESGLICARPHGYLAAGSCQKDLKHEVAE